MCKHVLIQTLPINRMQMYTIILIITLQNHTISPKHLNPLHIMIALPVIALYMGKFPCLWLVRMTLN